MFYSLVCALCVKRSILYMSLPAFRYHHRLLLEFHTVLRLEEEEEEKKRGDLFIKHDSLYGHGRSSFFIEKLPSQKKKVTY